MVEDWVEHMDKIQFFMKKGKTIIYRYSIGEKFGNFLDLR